jgi:hypothetical protein
MMPYTSAEADWLSTRPTRAADDHAETIARHRRQWPWLRPELLVVALLSRLAAEVRHAVDARTPSRGD